MLPLAAAPGSWGKSSFTFNFCLAEQSQIFLPAEHQLHSPHLCLPHTSKERECSGYSYVMENLIIVKAEAADESKLNTHTEEEE